MDGTLSSLAPGHETNAGLTYRLLRDAGQSSIYYAPGLQWVSWRHTRALITGRGIDDLIKDAYSYLAARYREGDRVYLFGYSRGAYAVRSLAGVIDRVGLLRPEHAIQRHINVAYRHYRRQPDADLLDTFRAEYCHAEVPIELIGVWDTVKALGFPLPFLRHLTERRHSYHNHSLSHSVRLGLHALAVNETRRAYRPVLWSCRDDFEGKARQVWFRGAHGDVGGHLNGRSYARPLSNVALQWMLENAQASGLPLPEDWRTRIVADAQAPAIGTWRGLSRFLLWRWPRIVGEDRSEWLHRSLRGHLSRPRRAPRGAYILAAEGRFTPSSNDGPDDSV